MLPRVILNNAVSLDSRIEGFDADIGLYYELAGRWGEEATLVGANTLLTAPDQLPDDDDAIPLAEPAPDDKRPLLVVPDSRGRVRGWNYWRSLPYWRDAVVLCSRATPQSYLDELSRKRVQTIVAGDNHVDYRAALQALRARFGVTIIRVDSGGTLNGVLLRAGLVDEISLVIHPALVGGAKARSFFIAPDPADGAIALRLVGCETVKDNILWLRYEVVK